MKTMKRDKVFKRKHDLEVSHQLSHDPSCNPASAAQKMNRVSGTEAQRPAKTPPIVALDRLRRSLLFIVYNNQQKVWI